MHRRGAVRARLSFRRGRPVTALLVGMIFPVVALVAVLAMHGATSTHEMAEHASSASAVGEMPSATMDGSNHGAGRDVSVGSAVAAVACAFAVLAGSSGLHVLVPKRRLPVTLKRWASQVCGSPEPPVPRLVAS